MGGLGEKHTVPSVIQWQQSSHEVVVPTLRIMQGCAARAGSGFPFNIWQMYKLLVIPGGLLEH